MWEYSNELGIQITALHTIFRRVLYESEIFAGERHDFWELVFIEEGSLCVAEDENVYEMQEKQLILHKPMEFHRFWAKNNITTKILVITFSMHGNMSSPLGDGIFSLSSNQSRSLINVYDMINSAFDDTINWYVPSIASDFLQIQQAILKLQLFLIDLLHKQNNVVPEHLGRSALNYQKIVHVLNEHICENLSIEDISKLTLLSVSNLKKTFNHYSGYGVMHYFNNLKILKATELLNTNMSINEISDQLGFSSPNYFSVVFKRETGMTPSEYKKQGLQL